MKIYTVYCSNISYDVSDAELDFADACKEAIIMPNEIDFDMDEEDYEEFKDDLDDYIANEISNATGWLVDSFEYSLKETEVDDE